MKNNAQPHLKVIQPQPFRTLDQEDDEPGRVRRTACRFYDRCNHVAIVLGWPGFTCAACPAFEKQEPDAKERDARAAITAAAEILRYQTDPDPEPEDPNTAPIAEIKWAA